MVKIITINSLLLCSVSCFCHRFRSSIYQTNTILITCFNLFFFFFGGGGGGGGVENNYYVIVLIMLLFFLGHGNVI